MFNTTNSFFFILNIVTGSLMNMFVYLCSPQKLRTICVCVGVCVCVCVQLTLLAVSAVSSVYLCTPQNSEPDCHETTQSPPPFPPPPPSPPPHAPSGQHRRHMGGSSPNLTYVDPQLIAQPNSPKLLHQSSHPFLFCILGPRLTIVPKLLHRSSHPFLFSIFRT